MRGALPLFPLRLAAFRSSAGSTVFDNFSSFSHSFGVTVFGLVVHRTELESVFAQSTAIKKAPRDCSLRANVKFIGWYSIQNRVNWVNRVNEFLRRQPRDNQCLSCAMWRHVFYDGFRSPETANLQT